MKSLDVQLFCGDCLSLMPKLATGSVDLVLCDLPYGITNAVWDRRIEMGALWRQYDRLVRRGGAVVLFAQPPFCQDVIDGHRQQLRAEWIWDKVATSGFLNARKSPLRQHESILVFGARPPRYHPQGLKRIPEKVCRKHRCETYGKHDQIFVKRHTGYPKSILRFSRGRGKCAQKPVELLEYLIRTYTSRGGGCAR